MAAREPEKRCPRLPVIYQPLFHAYRTRKFCMTWQDVLLCFTSHLIPLHHSPLLRSITNITHHHIWRSFLQLQLIMTSPQNNTTSYIVHVPYPNTTTSSQHHLSINTLIQLLTPFPAVKLNTTWPKSHHQGTLCMVRHCGTQRRDVPHQQHSITTSPLY